MKRELTVRQAAILDFVRKHIDATQRPPTFREIAAHIGVKSTNAVAEHLMWIERKGWIERDFGLARGIRFLP